MTNTISPDHLARRACVSPTLKKRRNLDGWSTDVLGGPGHGAARRFFWVRSASRLR